MDDVPLRNKCVVSIVKSLDLYNYKLVSFLPYLHIVGKPGKYAWLLFILIQASVFKLHILLLHIIYMYLYFYNDKCSA